MNSIKAEMTTTKYANEEHLMILIDGISFDVWLAKGLDHDGYLGLVPTWLGWLQEPKEQEYVWEKTEISKTEMVNLPILVCPDDADFSCTVIVCEVKYIGSLVRWNRIGCDVTGPPNYIGETIVWFEGVPTLEFSRQEYELCINKFVEGQD